MSTATHQDFSYTASCLFKEQVETGKFCCSFPNYWLQRKKEKNIILTYSYQSGNYVVSVHQQSREKVFLQSLGCTPNLMRPQNMDNTSQLVPCFVLASSFQYGAARKCCCICLCRLARQMKRPTEAEEHRSRQQLRHSLFSLFTQFMVLRVAEDHTAHVEKDKVLILSEPES